MRTCDDIIHSELLEARTPTIGAGKVQISQCIRFVFPLIENKSVVLFALSCDGWPFVVPNVF